MKNIFEETYQKELQAIAVFDAAKMTKKKKKLESFIMKPLDK